VTDPDPRVYFAAERTLLAWVRTGVTVIGLGFVVARFGLFLRLINPAHPDLGRLEHSSQIGVGLSIGGGTVTALAALQFVAFLRELRPHELPRTRLTTWLSVLLAVVVSAVGAALGIYLLR
jgi:putative membrane protein